MKRSKWSLMILLALVLTMGGVWFLKTPSSPVKTVTVTYGRILDRIAAQGKIEARTTVDLASKLDGRIRTIAVGEGAAVTKNRAVVILEDEYARAHLSLARAEVRDAELKLERRRQLYLSRAISKAEIDEAEIALDLARARRDQAQALLSDTVIATPIPGRVIEKHREEGESVVAGVPIVTIADVSKLRVRAEVDEEDVGSLAVGLLAQITSDAFPGRIFTGRVSEIGERVGKRGIKPEDPSRIMDTKVLEAKIDLEDPADFKLGMTVDVMIELARRDRVLIIPRRAIRRDERGDYVQVLSDGGSEIRRIVLGVGDRWDAEVLEGLKPNDPVVIP